MRHPEKNTSNLKVDDFDLELSADGIQDAIAMAKRLKALKVNPDLIVSSPAYRTRSTAEILAHELEYKKNIMYNEVLYQAFLNELIETISYTFDTVQDLMIVGHNPSLTALALTFVNHKEEVMPCTVLKVAFDCNSWIDISKENAKLIWIEKI